MKTLPKSLYFLGAAGISLLSVGDLYNSIGFLVCAVGGILLLCAFVWAVLLFCRHTSPKIRRIARIVKILTFTAIFAFLVSSPRVPWKMWKIFWAILNSKMFLM